MGYTRYILRERELRTLVGAVAVVAAALTAVWMRHGAGVIATTQGTPWSTYWIPSLLAAAAFAIFMRLLGVHRVPMRDRTPWLRIAFAVNLSVIALLAVGFFYRSNTYSRVSVALFVPLATLFVGAALIGYQSAHRRILRSIRADVRVLIVGGGLVAHRIGHALTARPGFYEVVGYLDHPADSAEDSERAIEADIARVGDLDGLEDVVNTHNVDEVIIAVPDASQHETMSAIGRCMQADVNWKVVPATFDLLLNHTSVDVVAGVPVLGIRDTNLVGIDRVGKRSFDLGFASAVLIVLSPLLLAAAALIRLTSRGPVFYRQTRVGLEGGEFTLLKFRTMYVDADAQIHQDFTADWIHGRSGENDGDVHKLVGDPRITPIGRFLRKTSLDELPQFWNVLRGEMSVVGPRPPLPYEVANYTEWHKRRLKAPPGITGLWQVSGRNELSFEQMVDLDIRYIETWRFENDLRIVAQTIPALLSDPGS